MNWYDVLQAVRRRKQDDEALLDLSTGEPIAQPELMKLLAAALPRLACERRLIDDLSRYDRLDGVPELAAAFAAECSRRFGRTVEHDEVLITPGAQAALRYVHEWLRGSGRCALYPMGLEFAGAVDPQPVVPPVTGKYESRPHANQCRITVDVSAASWERVGAAFLSRPHNPTGRLWSLDEVGALAEAAASHRALLVLDETYALPFAPLSTRGYETIDAPNVVHIYSFSKVGLAGERVGAIVGPRAVVDGLRSILRRSIIQTSKLGQHLALEAIAIFARRPDLADGFGALYHAAWQACRNAMRGSSPLPFRLVRWEGGPFMWCEWTGGPTSEEAFHALLDAGVAVAPSGALRVDPRDAPMGDHHAIRIGLGAPLDALRTAGSTIARVIGEMRSSTLAVA